MMKKLTNKFCRKIRVVLKAELIPKNKISAIITLAPVIHYSFRIIKWTMTEISKLDRQNLLTIHSVLNQKDDFNRLYIPKKDGGRSLFNMETSHIIVQNGLKTTYS